MRYKGDKKLEILFRTVRLAPSFVIPRETLRSCVYKLTNSEGGVLEIHTQLSTFHGNLVNDFTRFQDTFQSQDAFSKYAYGSEFNYINPRTNTLIYDLTYVHISSTKYTHTLYALNDSSLSKMEHSIDVNGY